MNKTLNGKVAIKKVKISLFGDIILHDVLIKDHKKDTLIYISKLRAIISKCNFISGNYKIFSVELDRPIVKMKWYKGDEWDNLTLFFDQFITPDNQTKSNFEQLKISNISIKNGYYHYIDEELNYPDIIKAKKLNSIIEKFSVDSTGLKAKIKKLTFIENRNLEAKEMSLDYHLSKRYMSFKNVYLKSKKSIVKGSVVFHHQSIYDWADFPNKVKINATLNKSFISLEELSKFVPQITSKQKISVSLNSNHTFYNLSLKNVKISSEKNTHSNLNFKISLKNNRYRFKFDIANLDTNKDEILHHFPNIKNDYFKISKLIQIKAKGKIDFSSNDIFGNLKIQTNLGNATIHTASISNLKHINTLRYSGNFSSKNLNIGTLIGRTDLARASINGTLKGYGIKRESLKLESTIKFHQLEYLNYPYQNIYTSVNFENEKGHAYIKSTDENFKLELTSDFNLENEREKYHIKGELIRANLLSMGLIQDKRASLKANITANLKGSDMENLQGDILIDDISYKNYINDYHFDLLKITSKYKNNIKETSIHLKDILDGNITGAFNYSDMIPIILNCIANISDKYSKEEIIRKNQNFYFKFILHSDVLNNIIPRMSFSKSTQLYGRVIQHKNLAEITFKSPKFNIDNNYFSKVNFALNTKEKKLKSSLKIAEFDNKIYQINHFKTSAINKNDTIHLHTNFIGGKLKSDTIDLSMRQMVDNHTNLILDIVSSKLLLNGNRWILNPNRSCRFTFDKSLKNYKISPIQLSHKKSKINIRVNKDNQTNKILIALKDFSLHKILLNTRKNMVYGNINGFANIIQINDKIEPYINLNINKLIYNNIKFGNLNLSSKWNKLINGFDIELYIDKYKKRTFECLGELIFDEKIPQLNLQTYLNHIDISFLAPSKDILENIKSYASGKLNINGDYNNPNIQGKITLNEGKVKIPFINVDFNLDNTTTVLIQDSQIIIPSTKISDIKYNTNAQIKGEINHDKYKKWSLNLDIETDKTLSLNTRKENNSKYYGQIFSSGKINISGDLMNPTIYIDASIADNSIFCIPVNYAKKANEYKLISFKKKTKNSTISKGIENTNTQKGLALNMNFKNKR